MWRRCLLAGLGTVGAGCVLAASASAATIAVRDEAQFQAAVSAFRDSGGRILLLPHLYRAPLVVGPRSPALLRIVGTRGARVQDLSLVNAQSVGIAHVTFMPLGGDSRLIVAGSRHVILDALTFTAAGTAHTVDLELDHSSRVTVRGSSFSHCGDASPEWSLCLQPQRADHVLIADNRFHDCRGCDFIHGRAGRDTTIRDNRFARALRCHRRVAKCIHQDAIELFAADGLVVSRNRFGVTERGGAQLYLTNVVDDVRIANNLFLRDDPRAPGVRSPVGIYVGAGTSPHLPHHVTIVNNTILSGTRTRKHRAMSIRVSRRYLGLARRNRPVIVNNVLARVSEPRLLCANTRRLTRNVVLRGSACSAANSLGDAFLGALGRPTSRSLLLIDRADPAYAPPRDYTGRPRGARPDIGCYEYVPR
jgi:hypothetical protein